MMKSIIAASLIIGLFLVACAQPKSNNNTASVKKKMTPKAVNVNLENAEEATFGAGCFWCIEAVFEELRGVISVESGYSGGFTKNPTYKDICTKKTGHVEVGRIVYDPDIISFETLLEVFWTTHNPTTKDRQGADVGPQYRSVIYYHNDTQKEIAEESMKTVATELWDDPIVTEISPLINYYPAEDYHQDYYALNPNYGYCTAVINPKMEKFRKRFADKLKGAEPDQSSALPPILDEGEYNELNDKESYVIRQKGTERAFSGAYHDNKKEGIYICRQCNQPLFTSEDKFDSGTGWPSFDDIYEAGAVDELRDADGRRTEIVCGNCDGHLGHVFRGERMTDKSTRHCVNSASLDFVPMVQ